MPRSSVETAIDELLNGLTGYDGRVVIVLDDLQHVSSERCLRSLAYAVLFLGGGATLQFAMVPLNLLTADDADKKNTADSGQKATKSSFIATILSPALSSCRSMSQ